MVRQHVEHDQPRARHVSAASPQQVELTRLLAGVRCVLLDFDGPVCSVFAGLPATQVADQLRGVLDRSGVAIADHLAETSSPFEILRFAAAVGADTARLVEHELRTAEMAAVRTASPTAGAEWVISACDATNRAVAIVSNNSTAAITAYLELRAINEAVQVVAGRTTPDPDLLKPDPHLVLTALHALDARAGDCVLVGDSESDVDSSHAAGVRCIGYANKPGKRARLADAGADAVIGSMNELAYELEPR